MNIFIIIHILLTIFKIDAFIKLPIGSPLSIKNKEINKKIIINLPPEDIEIVKQINGIYGVIGPDIDIPDIDNLYHLLLGNGIIQGIFFDNGELTFVKHYVKTEKLKYEEDCGKVLQNNWIYLFFYIFNKLNMLPNIFGLANTALIHINKKYYALYERDLPYEILFDFKNKIIKTGNKQLINSVEHFSAHPRINQQVIETIDYNVINKNIYFHQLSSDFVLQKTIKTPMKYLPIVHDFISTKYNYIVLDAPLMVKLSELHNKAMPVSLQKNKPTYIRVVNKYTGRVRTYETSQSFYLFHYAQIQEDENRIMIYAPMYDHIDFSELNIQGRYRKLILDKYSGNVTIEKRDELENLDMDFPVSYEDKIIFRNMKDKICEGFVICRDLEIVYKIFLEDRFVCGEPRVIYIKNISYLLTFVIDINNNKNTYILLINLKDYKQIEIPIDHSIQYGFHSFYIPK
jgi:carotenoid cleavage dioxygenase-like enzyme